QRRDLAFRKPADAKDRDFAKPTEHRQQHRVCDAQTTEAEGADADRPSREVEDLEAGVTLTELAILQGDEPGVLRFEGCLEFRACAAIAQLHREDRCDITAMKERLRIRQRHEDTAIFKAVLVANNAADMKPATPDFDGVSHLRPQELRRTRAEKDTIRFGPKVLAAA